MLFPQGFKAGSYRRVTLLKGKKKGNWPPNLGFRRPAKVDIEVSGAGSYRQVRLLNTDGKGKQPPKAFCRPARSSPPSGVSQGPRAYNKGPGPLGANIAYFALKVKVYVAQIETKIDATGIGIKA